jgi:predicted metal-dependent hydrolase
MFDYQLFKSDRRKTLSLQVKNGEVIVRAPTYLSHVQIDQFIVSKSSWLKSKLANHRDRPKIEKINFVNGDLIFILGKRKTLTVRYGNKNEVTHQSDSIIVILSLRSVARDCSGNHEKQPALVKKQLELWFKKQLLSYLDERLVLLSQALELYPTSHKVRQYKARWGSCDNKGALSFNYLLMMTPEYVIDYVIVHELCHLQHLNHSRNFWQLVQLHCPGFISAKSWLKDNNHALIWTL